MTAATPAAGDSWKSRLPHRRPALPGCGVPCEPACSSCLPPSRARLSTSWLWPSARPSPTPSCVGSCNIQPAKVAVGVQAAGSRRRSATAPPPLPHRSPDEPLRAWRWLIGLLVDEVCLARARAGMLVTLCRCIPQGLVIVDAPGPIGAVEMIFPKSLRRAIPGLLESRGLNGKSMQRRLGSPRLSH
jgi:hypothetical protein